MNPVDDIQLNFGGEDASAAPWLGEGWHGPEPDFRWTDGVRSVVRLPPLRAQPWFALTLQFIPLGLVAQTMTVRLNGVELIGGPFEGLNFLAVPAPGDLVREDGDNLLVIDHPHAASPAQLQPGNGDTRTLGLAFLSIRLAPLGDPLYAAPRLLARVEPPGDAAEAKAMVEMFQSLGHHCALGIVQRHYGGEPFGLLRFASIFPDRLVRGLQTRFQGIGDVEALSFFTPEGSRELHGRHRQYGLDYHTFRMSDETDVAALATKEAKRLDYLARLFFEQLENDEKIFVRLEGFRTPGEALALHQLLRAYHPRARLLVLDAPPSYARERVGGVIALRPGLYRGYLKSATDPAVGPKPDPEEWLRLMATVVAHERGRG